MDKIERNIGIVMRIAVILAVCTLIAGLMVSNTLILQIGIAALIATPVLRVLVSIISFAVEKDKLYVLITILVLLILVLSVVIGFML